MERNQRFDETLTTYVRPASFPVAVKFLGDEPLGDDIKRPVGVFGHPLALCQGVAMVRRYGWALAFTRDDHRCPSAIIALGYLETPDLVKRGDISVGMYARDAAAAARCEEAVLKMPVGSVSAMLMAPLGKATFTPDVVLIYGMPGQIVRLVQAANYRRGGALETRLGGRFACSAEFVVPHMEQRCNVILPGGGEKVFAMTENSEMGFALPGPLMEELTEGLVGTHKSGIQRFPFPVAGVRLEPEFPPAYAPFEEYCGLREPAPDKG